MIESCRADHPRPGGAAAFARRGCVRAAGAFRGLSRGRRRRAGGGDRLGFQRQRQGKEKGRAVCVRQRTSPGSTQDQAKQHRRLEV